MDGTIAVIFFIVSLTDMGINECPDGCLTRQDAPERFSIQGGDVIFQERDIGAEAYFGYDRDHRFGPFQPTYGLSLTDENAFWVGGGAKWTTKGFHDGPFFAELSFMPGLYAKGDGPKLGGPLHFRSAIGVGYEFDNGGTLTALFDHRSNGDVLPRNPGLETLSIRYSIGIE